MNRILISAHLLVFAAIFSGCSSTNISSSHKPTHSKSLASSISPSDIEVKSVSLSDFMAPDGKKYQRIKTQLVNNSQRPVRMIDGDIAWFDSSGKKMESVNYTIYKTFQDFPGILPGQTYTTLDDGGFLLPPYHTAASATVRITKVLEDSPL